MAGRRRPGPGGRGPTPTGSLHDPRPASHRPKCLSTRSRRCGAACRTSPGRGSVAAGRPVRRPCRPARPRGLRPRGRAVCAIAWLSRPASASGLRLPLDSTAMSISVGQVAEEGVLDLVEEHEVGERLLPVAVEPVLVRAFLGRLSLQVAVEQRLRLRRRGSPFLRPRRRRPGWRPTRSSPRPAAATTHQGAQQRSPRQSPSWPRRGHPAAGVDDLPQVGRELLLPLAPPAVRPRTGRPGPRSGRPRLTARRW